MTEHFIIRWKKDVIFEIPDVIGSTTVSDHSYLADDIYASEYILCDNSQGEFDDTTILDIIRTDPNKDSLIQMISWLV